MLRLLCTLIGLSLLLVATGCDDTALGPQTRGDLEGEVRDAQTDAPVANVNITTSPPTNSVLTGDNGTFALNDIETGNYTVSASKSNYKSNTVTVSVRENQVTDAVILLEPDDSATEKQDSIDVSVVNWSNREVNDDTTFVDVEYRVRNVGEVDIEAYEVYFRIDTGAEAFFHEAQGDSLKVNQNDVTQFEKFIRDRTATEVAVDDVWFEPVDS